MITAMPARWMALAAGISRPPVLSMTTRATLCFLRYSIVWAIPFGLLVSVLVLDKDETAMTKFRLAMSMPAQLYWVLIINLPCIRLCCLATVRLCRWVARPLPELRNGCLPWVCTGGGWARYCYDTEVPIYKGVCPKARTRLQATACYNHQHLVYHNSIKGESLHFSAETKRCLQVRYRQMAGQENIRLKMSSNILDDISVLTTSNKYNFLLILYTGYHYVFYVKY